MKALVARNDDAMVMSGYIALQHNPDQGDNSSSGICTGRAGRLSIANSAMQVDDDDKNWSLMKLHVRSLNCMHGPILSSKLWTQATTLAQYHCHFQHT